MPGFNHVVLTGKVASEPKLEYVAGSAICNFDLRIKEGFNVSLTTHRKLAEICGQNLHKGRGIVVSGTLEANGTEFRVRPERMHFSPE